MNQPYFATVPSVGIEITSRCNLSCRHCFNNSGEGVVQELSQADLGNIFAQVHEMGQIRIRLSGGEPTLHPDFGAIVREAGRWGLYVSVNSHGLYSPQLRAQISELPIELYIISLEGLREANDCIRGAGTFDRAVDAVTWLHALGRAVTLGIHLRRSNIDDIPGLISMASELGVGIKFSPLRPIGRASVSLCHEILAPAEFYRAVQTITALRAVNSDIHISTDFDILKPTRRTMDVLPEQASCPAGRTMLNINYDGYVYPCAFLVTPEREFAAGSIHDAPLSTIWRESPAFVPFRTLEKDGQCRQCFAYGQTCLGGCVAMAYFATGQLAAHDPSCFTDYVSPVASPTDVRFQGDD